MFSQPWTSGPKSTKKKPTKETNDLTPQPTINTTKVLHAGRPPKSTRSPAPPAIQHAPMTAIHVPERQ
jgi:hypothetical protein